MLHSRLTDRALAQRTREGDERAFAVLVGRHRDTLVRFVSRRARPELAEDAVQEALASAHAALQDGRVPSDVRAWLHTIAWRRALDLLRGERLAAPLDEVLLASPADGPADAAMRRDEFAGVVRAWADLPERQRAALVLSVLEGRSVDDIATALDVSGGAAKAVVSRARRTLAERIASAEADCDSVREHVVVAATRGVRLSAHATRHVQGCTGCSRLHRELRRQRRYAAVLFLPTALAVRFETRFGALRDRLRDIVLLPSAEPQVSSVAKLCAVACAGTLAGTPTALVATAPVVAPEVRPAKTERREPDRSAARPQTDSARQAPATAPAVVPAAAPAPESSAVPVRAQSTPRTVQRVSRDQVAPARRLLVAAGATDAPPASTPAGATGPLTEEVTEEGGTTVLRVAPTEAITGPTAPAAGSAPPE
ncbi:MAG: sigma-70 family RNA polymerase sigma factor [Solirubrobacteraceae bacterium]|nr:sigma-70 family RNA polymerase sigma factor [Solirubrobacteraceae bacterium]